jgi:hypothetical protein
MAKRYSRKELIARHQRGVRYRVTVRITRAEIDYLRRIARRTLPPAPNGKPRTGMIVSKLLQDALDRVRGIELESE